MPFSPRSSSSSSLKFRGTVNILHESAQQELLIQSMPLQIFSMQCICFVFRKQMSSISGCQCHYRSAATNTETLKRLTTVSKIIDAISAAQIYTTHQFKCNVGFGKKTPYAILLLLDDSYHNSLTVHSTETLPLQSIKSDNGRTAINSIPLMVPNLAPRKSAAA